MQVRRTAGFFFLFLIVVVFMAACGGGGGSTPASTPASKPTVQATAADNLSITGATLHGSVNPNGTATKAYFQWTTDVTFPPVNVHSTGEQTIGSDSAFHPMPPFVLDGRTPGTKIYYRVYAYNSAGPAWDNVPVDFTTLTLPPVVTTDNATLITASSATLNGTVDPKGLETTYYFKWGTTQSMTNPPTTTRTILAGKYTPQPVSENLGSVLSAGTRYYCQLVAQNSAGAPVNGEIKPFDSLLNPPPNADAGLDQTIFMGHTVTLDGTGSSPSDPSRPITSYEWTQLPGTAVTLSDSTSPTPTFTAPVFDNKAGEILQFQLTVTDNNSRSQSDTVNVAVKWGFLDDFSANTIGDYGTFFISGSSSTFTYDGAGDRGRVDTGTGQGLIVQSDTFSAPLQTNTGVFSLDFTPIGSYTGSRYITIRLNDTESTYYEISTGNQWVKKAIKEGTVDNVVETLAFPYYQDTPGVTYPIKFTFNPESLTVEAFGATVTMNPSNTNSITVNYIEIWTSEQNAYYDNIQLEAAP